MDIFNKVLYEIHGFDISKNRLILNAEETERFRTHLKLMVSFKEFQKDKLWTYTASKGLLP